MLSLFAKWYLSAFPTPLHSKQTNKPIKQRDKEHLKGTPSKAWNEFFIFSPLGVTSPTWLVECFSCSLCPLYLWRGREGRVGWETAYLPFGESCVSCHTCFSGQAENGTSFAGLWWIEGPFSSLTTSWSLALKKQLLKQTGLSCYQNQNTLEISELLRTKICRHALWVPDKSDMSVPIVLEGRRVLRCQEEMAVYPGSCPKWGPWCLGCCIVEQGAVSWACF